MAGWREGGARGAAPLNNLGFDNLAKLPDMVTGIRVTAAEFKTAGANALCEPCTLGKQHRLPFNTSTSATKAPLELLHTDLCGPLPVASAGGSLYFNTILDDFTGMSFVIPLRHKSDAADSIIHTVTMLQRQAGLPVKRVRSDNGGEFCNSTLSEFYTSQGVLHETTNPYSPQQNGKAERLNRTLWEKARPMLSDAGLPEHLWADAIVTANYLRNRSPLSGRDKTPFELFYGTKPDVSHLRIFGATVFAHTPSALRTKLDPVSQPGRLIGYAANRKGYKILLSSLPHTLVGMCNVVLRGLVQGWPDQGYTAPPSGVMMQGGGIVALSSVDGAVIVMVELAGGAAAVRCPGEDEDDWAVVVNWDDPTKPARCLRCRQGACRHVQIVGSKTEEPTTLSRVRFDGELEGFLDGARQQRRLVGLSQQGPIPELTAGALRSHGCWPLRR
ncbi:Retrovirus-related Pol poly from transposon TNT 1-94 [Micractinium conductrix]|uniref:Retrovirus-related Pol poly from transposon TNT 1-94 n=1 Tax=Micractinium conductrix TaxID=554055 RepID=A0A2P6VS73_9CHLO|nr:Retrovirus-related Pol poly from transposon TNT 1-94 [Micractinium conductrix]|eukprot:PSC76941.1 Retrovirus-related Pol poly from transposon TNT 1-94 [Micractinium conductrix]